MIAEQFSPKPRVVYLFGAGASHACVRAVGSAFGILMRDLNQELAERLSTLVEEDFGGNESLRRLANDFAEFEPDFEHIITFLDESPSALHRKFAAELRTIFEDVLRGRINKIKGELGRVPDDLYFLLLDMYSIHNFPESLAGFLTLNYDTFLEAAIERSATHYCDPGVPISRVQDSRRALRTLKLHGSFEWQETWPITAGHGESTLWIPPGIEKAKQRYPFNLLWGLARELLDCDIVRVVGCRLAANDWDLISLLFATRNTNLKRQYRIEVIDAPAHVRGLQQAYPYLSLSSMLEVEPIGSQLIAEHTGESRLFASLTKVQQLDVIDKVGAEQNWFHVWLKQKSEATFRELGSVATASGAVETFLRAD